MITPDIKSRMPSVGTTIFTTVSRLATDHGAINTGQGFPDFEPPSELIECVHRHLKCGGNQYAPMAGAPSLLTAIAAKVQRCYHRSVDPLTEVTVTCGGTEALTVAIQALVHPGDEVIILDPSYDSYAPIIELVGASAVRIPLLGPTFLVDWERIHQRVNDRTRMIIINNPHNPSGACLNAADLSELERLVERWPVLILADEVYEHMVFDSRPHQSLHRSEVLRERAVIVASLGKTYHVTGWKVGYCVAPAVLTAEIRKLHQFVTFAISHPMQLGLADFLNEHPEWDQNLGGFYQAKRDRLIRGLSQSLFTFIPTPSTYFQVVDYSQISALADVEFVQKLIVQHKVAAIPLSVFYEMPPIMRQVRLCFAKSDAILDEAAHRLSQVTKG